MHKCLICFNPVEDTLNNNKVCLRCLSKFKIIEKRFWVNGVEVFILYSYNDFFKELLYRYKGCYDYALKDAFLCDYINKLKRKYKGYKVICAPSYFKDDKIRGFNHVEEIVKRLNLEILHCLKKCKNYKQSSKEYSQRCNIQKIIKIDKTLLKGCKKILIVDDVATSLSTIKTIIRLMPTNIDIKVFVFSSNCRFMEDENI